MSIWKEMIFSLFAVIATQALMSSARGQQDSVMANAVYLDQGWSHNDRLRYYFTSLGSAAISYDIFLNLEQANEKELFRADENLSRYGLVPGPTHASYNPDGLPIGLTKTVRSNGRWKGEWVGFTCAACHNGQLRYKGTVISISGGSNQTLDIRALIAAMDEALVATLDDPKKFDRLAERMGQRTPNRKEELLSRLGEDAANVHHYYTRSLLRDTPFGPGRMDGLGLMHNRIAATLLDTPENWTALVAPVKPSSCWNQPQSAWVQWLATMNDPLIRNAGKSLGVFVKADLTSDTQAEGLFDSTIDLKGHLECEALLRRLAPPQWPQDVLGKIDRDRVARGRKLFSKHCAGCHSTWPHRWSEPRKQGQRFIENAVVPGEWIGTDTKQFSTPLANPDPVFISGRLSPFLRPPDQKAILASGGALFEAAVRKIVDRALDKLKLSEDEVVAAHGFQPVYPETVKPAPPLRVYKAAPIDGMWASPPFLHNGSVPNLYELLLPARERSNRFFIGREFDPVKVGVDTSGNSGNYIFDTSLVGNSNAGHSFEDGPQGHGVIGPLLDEDERWALIEYIKSRPAQPGQVTPFGGPKNPVRAWGDQTFYNVKYPVIYDGSPKRPLAPPDQSPQPRIRKS